MQIFSFQRTTKEGSMKALLTAIFLVTLTIPMLSSAQTASGGSAGPQPNSGQSAIMAASNSLRILAPTVDDIIGSTSVTLRCQLPDTTASAAPSPTYRVQLDGRDPAETVGTEYSFT